MRTMSVVGVMQFALAASGAQSDVQNATTFAYTYGYPFYAYGQAVRGSPNATTNSLIHQRDLANASETWVVRPNADTLYTRAFLDLSTFDLEITVPEFDNRYWIWPFYDAYGNNVANIGSVGSNEAGTYLVRYSTEGYGVETTELGSPYQAYITLPTPYGISLTRILPESSDDLDAVHELQDQLCITQVSTNQTRSIPILDLDIFNDSYYIQSSNVSLEEAVLRLTAEFASWNLPIIPGDEAWVSCLLEQAGISNGVFTQKIGTNLTAASASANASASALLGDSDYVHDLGGNWTAKDASIIGLYDSQYVARYQISTVGYLALVPEQAVYPSYRYGKSNNITSQEALLLTFSEKPKINPGGFWSLTAYDGNGYLIDNPLDRYALGDRSNLTFANGSSLRDGDGMFQILVQPGNLEPPTNWTNNWLPAPENGGIVSLNLRL
ncbi:hypothetical protein E8E14_006507 [Neopestalotiopsis sp. 37M]|nr:hypothetical protein E8E14_006507 [Neopestalotiopsis sp. 37M]